MHVRLRGAKLVLLPAQNAHDHVRVRQRFRLRLGHVLFSLSSTDSSFHRLRQSTANETGMESYKNVVVHHIFDFRVPNRACYALRVEFEEFRVSDLLGLLRMDGVLRQRRLGHDLLRLENERSKEWLEGNVLLLESEK